MLRDIDLLLIQYPRMMRKHEIIAVGMSKEGWYEGSRGSLLWIYISACMSMYILRITYTSL